MSTNHKSSNRIELCRLTFSEKIIKTTAAKKKFDHTQPRAPTFFIPSNSLIFPELKYLDKLKCYQILSDSWGPPPSGGGRQVMGVEVGMGVWGDVFLLIS